MILLLLVAGCSRIRVTSPGHEINEKYIQDFAKKYSGNLGVGFAVHAQCIMKTSDPQRTQDVPGQYTGLVKIATEQLSAENKISLAHQCERDGHKFVHIITGEQASLIVTRKNDGEMLASADLTPTLNEAGLTLYQQGVDIAIVRGTEATCYVTAFETPHHFVFLVSVHNSQEKNLRLAASVAPAIKDLLANLEN